jgi:hypothetical protein
MTDYESPRAEIAAALAAANTLLTNPVKDRVASMGTYGYAYASLDTVLAHVRPVLAAHGLSIMQDISVDGNRVNVSTAVLHSSGESIATGPIGGPTGGDYQALGSAITYLRRYGVLAALGLATDEDDDGATAPKHTETPTAARPDRDTKAPTDRMWGAKNGTATPKQIGMVKRLMAELGETEVTLNDYTTKVLGFEMPREGLDTLGKNSASSLIDSLMSRTKTDNAKVTRVSHSDQVAHDTPPISAADIDPWVTDTPPDPNEVPF